MNMVVFRKDLEAFHCENCKSEIFHVCSINRKFYCYDCAQNVEEIEENDTQTSDTDGLHSLSGEDRGVEQPGVQHGQRSSDLRALQPVV